MKILVASPVYKAMEIESILSFNSLFLNLQKDNLLYDIDYPWAVVYRDSNQARARNVLFDIFLQSKADKLLILDADQTFEYEQITQLLKHDVDVIVPLMNRKYKNGGLIGLPLAGNSIETDGSELVEMQKIGFGMVIFTRSCIEKISKDRIAKNSYFIHEGRKVPEIVCQTVHQNEWLAVDDVFSIRWRGLGGKMWLDPNVQVGHIGPHVF